MSRSALLLLLSVAAASVSLAADDDDDEYRPGLVASWANSAGQTIRSRTRNCTVVHGEPFDRRLDGDKLKIAWRGRLQSVEPGEYRLFAFGSGRVRIALRGESLLDETATEPRWLSAKPIKLEFDYHPLTIELEAPRDAARLTLFWSGPTFSLEPLPERRLFHEPQDTPSDSFARGGELVRALRCAACHEIPGEPPPLAAPSLEKLRGQIFSSWTERWLSDAPRESSGLVLSRRMPHFAFSTAESQALAAYLEATSGEADLSPPRSVDPPKPEATKDKAKEAEKSKKGTTKIDTTPNPLRGEQLAHTLGCLACHRIDPLGEGGLYGGGDLTRIAEKRPADFFAVWLAEPVRLNAAHRMPVFSLSTLERNDLAAYLATKRDGPTKNENVVADREKIELGKRLFAEHRCAACHAGPEKQLAKPAAAPKLDGQANWSRSCAANEIRRVKQPILQPTYVVEQKNVDAIREFVLALSSSRRTTERNLAVDATALLRENNCVACHARDGELGLAPKLPELVKQKTQLAGVVPTLTPPSLVSVGDKLYDAALAEMLHRTAPPHRPWLQVRMPKFSFPESQRQAIVAHLAAVDRIPDRRPASATITTNSAPASTDPREIPTDFLHSTGGRLVTVDGFGCTSCHIVGKQIPPKAPPNARGPDLSMLGQRIRRDWFDRWVRNPARIIPGMEMPSVQIPVRGVLAEHLPTQLAAVWQVLNTPGFEPPEPNPIQVLRLTGVPENNERVEIVTDVLNHGSRQFIKPLLIGLPNRHSVLLDLETNRVARWSFGDVARQRTKGKSWFWETAGETLWETKEDSSEIVLARGEQTFAPAVTGQFVTEPDEWRHVPSGFELRHRLRFSLDNAGTNAQESTKFTTIHLRQTWTAIFGGSTNISGLRRVIVATGVPRGAVLKLQAASSGQIDSAPAVRAADGRSFAFGGKGGPRMRIVTPRARLDVRGDVELPSDGAPLELEYLATLPVDQFFPVEKPLEPLVPQQLLAAPGFEVTRLPLRDSQMPMALSWSARGELFVASLKGRVWRATNTNGDGFEDVLQPFTDEIPAPYGLWAGDDFVDVAAKFGVLRFHDADRDGRAERMELVASGWGHTADYHDWLVGLPRTPAGEYFLGLPCQQDKRSAAAAKYRGQVLKLTPREPTADDPRRFAIQTVSSGHRFPMGLALNRAGALFATDNQGNFNPFNELNHVRPGVHFGFINANERGQPAPPATAAAVELPHPWTRSVNGICFLESNSVRAGSGRGASEVKSTFGPYEGHLVGCEYDTRRLVRISLQPTGETFQGCAYPLTPDSPQPDQSLLGPVSAAVSPSGDLYIGGIRDSGWGGANNIGELVRLRFRPDKLPPGIVEVRAIAAGFEIDLQGSIDSGAVTDAENFSLVSYRRISTPAYGGADQDRRTEKIERLEWNEAKRRVTVRLAELRPGFVYELRLKNLAATGQQFFPAEAYFTVAAAGL